MHDHIIQMISLLPMPTSKFCVSFAPSTLGDTILSTQELVLDLDRTGVSIAPEAITMEAECPDAGEACTSAIQRSPHLEHPVAALEAVPAQDPATLTRRGSFNSD
jgi:hypothetical protein